MDVTNSKKVDSDDTTVEQNRTFDMTMSVDSCEDKELIMPAPESPTDDSISLRMGTTSSIDSKRAVVEAKNIKMLQNPPSITE